MNAFSQFNFLKIFLLFALFSLMDNWAFAGYMYYRAITVQSSQISGGANLTQFPILVCANGASPCNASIAGLNHSGGGAHVQNANGYDIIFTTDSGCSNKLTWEMEDYVASTGEFEAWVANTSTPLSYSANTTFYMCYGNAAISSFQSTASSVWDSNYKGVWHLANGTALSAINSITGTSGTINGPVAASAGAIDGGGIWGAHTTDAVVTDINTSSSQTTYSIWAYRTGNGGNNLGRMFDKRTSGVQVDELLNNAGSDYDYVRTWSTTNGEWVTTSIPTSNAWHYIVVSYDSSSTSNVPVIYFDGVSQGINAATSPAGTLVNNSDDYVIGNRTNDNARNWAGSLDEFRISSTIRSAGWIVTEYNNQSAPSSFYTMGSEGSCSGACGGQIATILNNAVLNNYKHF